MIIQIVLKLSKKNHAAVVLDGFKYAAAVLRSPYFVDPAIKAQAVKTQASSEALHSAVSAPPAPDKNSKIARARDVLNRDITKLASMVAAVANDPAVPDAEREAIAHSAAMVVKRRSGTRIRTFTVTDGETSGTVLLTAAGKAKAHEWQYTTDIVKYTEKTPATTITKGTTKIVGLTPRTDYAFFHRAVVANKETPWEGPVFWFVK